MTLQKHADNIRRRVIEESYRLQTAHVGSCLSCVDILTVLFFRAMKTGDRFVLSAGHKALALYCTLVEKGVLESIDLDKLGGHPKKNPALGIEFSTGSLGHGLSLGTGLAIADPKHNVYVLLSDGDMEEGSTMEAINFIIDNNVKNIFGIVDSNGWTAYQKAKLPLITVPFILVQETPKGLGLKRFENKLESHYWKVTKEDLNAADLC